MPETMLDVFSGDAFSSLTLTAAVNELPYVPGRIGRLGLHEETGIATTMVAIERDGDTLALVPNTPRGAPANQLVKTKRRALLLEASHLPVEATIQAHELQNVRAFGSANQLAGVDMVVNQKLAEIARRLDATLEYHKLGSVKGVVLDADGSSVLFDLFTEFEVTQTSIGFALTTDATKVRGKCTAVSRAIEDALGGGTYDHVHAVCGADFMDALIDHPNVIETIRALVSLEARRDLRQGFEFGGIVFEEYRGKVGAVDFVAAGEAHFFPVGVPGLFKTNFAPGNFIETVNTLGLPRYAKAAVDRDLGQWVKIHGQSNPIAFCTRPKVLVKGTKV